ncbi:MAG: hypothetical protein ABFD29_04855 [Anaerolineaceae bacterium]|jgi:cytochrome b
MRTIRASEIGTYLFCARAWWYQLQGKPNENQAEMAGGTDYHQRVGKRVASAVIIRIAGWGLLLAALALAAVWLTLRWIG